MEKSGFCLSIESKMEYFCVTSVFLPQTMGWIFDLNSFFFEIEKKSFSPFHAQELISFDFV